MAILKIKDLTLNLNGKNILDHLNIDFWEGHVHAIVGPNGAGKSTLAYTVMGLEGYRNIEGDILFEEKSIKNLKIDERARLGITLAWQEPARYEGLTVRRILKALAKNNDLSIMDALDKTGLNPDSYLDRAVDKTLSGGERKKLELASILVMKPKLVLLDEPDSGIDVASLEKIFDSIDLLKRYGSTVILITHSLTVMRHAEHAFLMCGGKLIEKGNIERIISYFEENCIPCDHKNMPDLGRGNNGC